MLRVVLGRKEGKEETRRRGLVVVFFLFFVFRKSILLQKKREALCVLFGRFSIIMCIMTLVALYYLYHYYSDGVVVVADAADLDHRHLSRSSVSLLPFRCSCNNTALANGSLFSLLLVSMMV